LPTCNVDEICAKAFAHIRLLDKLRPSLSNSAFSVNPFPRYDDCSLRYVCLSLVNLCRSTMLCKK